MPDSLAIAEAARRILAFLGPTEVLAQLCREGVTLSGADGALAVAIGADQPWSEACFGRVSGAAELPVSDAGRSALYAVHRRLAVARGPQRLEDLDEGLIRALANATDCPIGDLRALPVFGRGGRVAGLLLLVSSSRSALELARLDLLEALCACASTALENAARFAVARRDQERLLMFSEASEEVLWEWTIDTGQVWWGSGLQRVLGGSGLEPRGTLEWKLGRVHPADVERVRASLSALANSLHTSWREQYRFRRSDDSWADVADRGYVLRDETGRAFRVVGALHDVTEQRRAAIARQFLLDASAVLASEVELGPTLERLARLAVEQVADGCSIWTVRGGTAEHVAAHRDPRKLAILDEVARRWASPVDPDSAVAEVFRTGEPMLVAQITPELVARRTRSPEHREALRELAPTSYLLVPLRTSGRILGALALTSESERRFDARDLALAVALGERAAVAIERAALFQELAEHRERLEVTLASIGDGVIRADASGTVQFVNPAAERLTGWKAADAIGRRLGEVFRLIDESTGEPVEAPTKRVLAGEQLISPTRPSTLVRRDGGKVLISDSAAPIGGPDGEPIGVVLVFRDVTDKKRLDDELLRASRLDSLGLLAGGIAHDFNNLLTAILANLSMAETKLGPEHPIGRHLSGARAAGERAVGLTKQLLTFARGGAPVRSSTALPDLLRDTCSFALQGSRSALDLRVAPDLRPVVADGDQISQVVQNLVINASQAMPDGGCVQVLAEDVHLTESSAVPLPAGDYVRVAITDEGLGIPTELLDRIFDPFFTTKPSGTGLGLATVFSIVRKHEGHVTVDSRPGEGATFAFYLPVAVDPPAPVARPAMEALVEGGRVLVMDDEAAIVDLARSALTERGLEVVTTRHGAEAIGRYEEAIAAGRPFDVVVLDLTVPGGLGGRGTLERLRELDPEVCAVVSSGYSNDPVLANASAYGFSDVLPKPYLAEDLVRAVGRVLARRAGTS